MGIEYTEQTAVVSGRIGPEEAEALMQWLQGHADGQVHLGACEHLHAAALQCLLALKPQVVAAPADRWLSTVLNLGSAAADKGVMAPETQS